MTKRDTIVGAALVNAGLLVMLFVCALGIDETDTQKASRAGLAPSISAVAQGLQVSNAPALEAVTSPVEPHRSWDAESVELPNPDPVPPTSQQQTARPQAGGERVSSVNQSKQAAAAVKTAGEQYHYVQRGESPWTIAKKYGIGVDKLLKLNHLDEEMARRLREGDRLRVR